MMDATTVWHAGELAVQHRTGVDPARSAKVAAFMRPFLTMQHRDFYGLLPFIVAGTVDARGAPWATLLEGRPGFLQALDEQHLQITAQAAPDDPASAGLRPGNSIGLLGIELPTRRRNRVNGHIEQADDTSITMAVDQAFGNCPRYIQPQDLAIIDEPSRGWPAESLGTLDEEARLAIASATTLFVASYVDTGTRQVDVSHRGGPRGFIRVDGDVLTIPDYNGNQFYNTLGNLFVNPRAGLAFPDFTTGDMLQLTGRTEIVFEGPEVAAFEGAERLWRVHVERAVRRREVLKWRDDGLDSAA